jgi:hypothetical protein
LWVHTNILAKRIIEDDPECLIVVTGGDDVWPDPRYRAGDLLLGFLIGFGGTLGVMQPTGANPPGHAGLAWSPWLGREWCERAFEGRGPTDDRFWHYYNDLYLADVARRHGVFWERPDLNHTHRNWKELRQQRPQHLAKSRDRWAADKALYQRLLAEGYPGSGLLPA